MRQAFSQRASGGAIRYGICVEEAKQDFQAPLGSAYFVHGQYAHAKNM